MRYLVPLVLLLAGCQTVAPGYWHRQSDGLRVDATPALLERFNLDRSICDGEAAKAALASNERDRFIHQQSVNLVFDGCLVSRGYVRR